MFYGSLMVHAGVLPGWTAAETLALAQEVQTVLRGVELADFLRSMYGDQPRRWDDSLRGADRLRVIVNALTRLRFCSAEGAMEFGTKDGADAARPQVVHGELEHASQDLVMRVVAARVERVDPRDHRRFVVPADAVPAQHPERADRADDELRVSELLREHDRREHEGVLHPLAGPHRPDDAAHAPQEAASRRLGEERHGRVRWGRPGGPFGRDLRLRVAILAADGLALPPAAPPPPKPEPVRRPAKVAQQLALAHHLQAAIDRGAIADRADVARKLGLTRARVTQLLDLLLLAPDLQDAVLGLEAVDGAEPVAERTLRAVAHAGTWAEQRAAWPGRAILGT